MQLSTGLAYAEPRRLWSPVGQLGYYAHFDASLPQTLTRDGSNLVSQWRSIAGGGVSLDQSSDPLKPTWQTNLQNGLPGVTFDSDALSGTVAINADELTICAAVSMTSGSTSNGVGIGLATIGGTSNDADGWEAVKRNAATEAIHTRQNGTQGASNSITYGAALALIAVKSSASIRIGVNGTSATMSRTWTLQAVRMSVGAALTAGGLGTAYFSGNWHEIIVFKRGLELPERVLVSGYLAWRWGLPLGSQTYSSAPP